MKIVEYLPSILLILLVVVVIVVAIFPKTWPLAKSFLGLNATLILSPVEKSRDAAQVFFEHYSRCIDSENTNCKCVFDLDLEKNFVIRLQKIGDKLRVMLRDGNLRRSNFNIISGDIEEDIMPCVYVNGVKETSDFLDIGELNKLRINRDTYGLPEQLILYKIDKDVCTVPFKKGREEFNIEDILNLNNCKLDKI